MGVYSKCQEGYTHPPPGLGKFPARMGQMVTRREAAQRLDIPLEMAVRHGLPPQLTEAAVVELDTTPPAWLAQSRANRTGKRPVWSDLVCAVCGFTERARPKKWWPEFTYVVCDDHEIEEWPKAAPGAIRAEVFGVGGRFVGLVDDVA